MPLTYVIDAKVRVVYITLYDVVTFAEFVDARTRLMGEPAFDPTFSQLLDMRLVSSLRMTGDSVRKLAHETAFSGTSPRALVVANNLHSDLAQMYATYRLLEGGKERIRIFADMDSAMKWLGLPSDYHREQTVAPKNK
jgi:hypothetical protein